jgi:hypothetical protein
VITNKILTVDYILANISNFEVNEGNFDSIAREMGVDYNNNGDNSLIKEYVINRWLCTDTHVGVFLYTFKEKPFAMMRQNCRECVQDWSFFSENIYEVKEYLIKLLIVEEDDEVALLSLYDVLFYEYYQLTYASQILQKHCYYNGNKCQVGKRGFRQSVISKKVNIILPDGESKDVMMREIYFKIGE